MATQPSLAPGAAPRSRYHGRLERERRTPSMRLVVSNYASGTRLPRHDHAHAHLCIVLRGEYEERIGRRTFERAPLDIVWYPEEADHAEAFRSNGRHLIVDLERTPDCATAREVKTLPGSRPLAGAVQLLRLLGDEDSASEFELEEAVVDLLAQVEPDRPEERAQPAWIPRVETELHGRYREPLTLDELARTAGVSVPHLARTWRHFRHETLGETLRGLRAAYACRALARGTAGLAEIALEAGFADQSHMGRILRRHVGDTPAGLQRTLRS